MFKKTASIIALVLLLSITLISVVKIQPAKSEPRTWIVDDDGPADFHTIREAINNASEGDTVFVRNGTYYENIAINKTVALAGENLETTIIDGGGKGITLSISSSNVNVSGFTIQNGRGHGIWIKDSVNSMITGNNVMGNEWGIRLVNCSIANICRNNLTGNWFGITINSSSDNSISDNYIIHNSFDGITLSSSSNITISDNVMKANWYAVYANSSWNTILFENNITDNGVGITLAYSSNSSLSKNLISNSTWSNFRVWGDALEHFIHSIDASNLVDNKPVFYLLDKHDLSVNPTNHPEVGFLALVDCDNMTVEGLSPAHNSELLLAFTRNSKILANNVTGIDLYNSMANSISENYVATNNNGFGIVLHDSSGNLVNGNNVVDNYFGVFLDHSLENNISGNMIAYNWHGIEGLYSSHNTVTDNNIESNGQFGICLDYSWDNQFYHNNFMNNACQAATYDYHNSTWNNSCEGNYWSDYSGADSDGDGVGDTPYIIDSNYDTDHFPLMNPYWIPADVNHDLKVSILDVVKITGSYGTTPSDPDWNPHADIAEPFGKIDILDVVLCTSHYGEKWK